jgi:AraC family transcriptional regulator
MEDLGSLRGILCAACLFAAEGKNSSPHETSSKRALIIAAVRIGRLVTQARNLLATDCEAARRCLSDASRLLGPNEGELTTNAQPVGGLRPGGLAAWQARLALGYIDVHLGSAFHIDDLANELDLSKSHFCRAFKRSVGLPPKQYVLMRRLERAKALISGTRESLSDVALACGFADQSHLTRRFRKVVGIPPGRWRRSHTESGGRRMV